MLSNSNIHKRIYFHLYHFGSNYFKNETGHKQHFNSSSIEPKPEVVLLQLTLKHE